MKHESALCAVERWLGERSPAVLKVRRKVVFSVFFLEGRVWEGWQSPQQRNCVYTNCVFTQHLKCG